MLIAFYAAALLVLGFWYGQRHAANHPQDARPQVQAVQP
jgi:hypothetical protein